MSELPSLDGLDDDIEEDLYDGIDLETSVFVRKETAVNEKAKKLTSITPCLRVGTSAGLE